jgi:hypothetical protein
MKRFWFSLCAPVAAAFLFAATGCRTIIDMDKTLAENLENADDMLTGYLPPQEFLEVETPDRLKFVIPPGSQVYYLKSFDKMLDLQSKYDYIQSRSQHTYNFRNSIIHVFKEKKYVELWFYKQETDYWIIFKIPASAFKKVFLQYEGGDMFNLAP